MRTPALVLAAACLLAAPLAPSGARAQAYPRLGLYGSISGDGTPYLASGGALNPVALDQAARYDVVILDVNPITPYRPDVLTALRTRNPDIRALAYVLGHDIWPAADPDSLNHYPTLYRRTVRDLDGYLYDRVTGQLYAGANVNLAKRDIGGRFVVAEALADLFADRVLGTGAWDGIFLDVYCSTLSWTQDGTHQIDFARAGYASSAAFDAAWQAGSDTLANRLRRRAPAGMVLVGNCAQSAHQAVFNGWMRENFPFQGGGNWYENMLDGQHGYFADDANYRAPAHNWIFTAMLGGTGSQYMSTNTRKVRFGLGSAALGEGYGVFGPSDRNVQTAPYHEWWYDEYAVDLATGHASTSLAHTGWLGQPQGPAYQMIWAGSNPDACTNPGFESSVTSGWAFAAFAPAAATLTADATTAAVGSTSAHVSVTSASPTDWHVSFTSSGQIPLTVGQTYSATFWAKASPARSVPVIATRPGGGSLASRTITIGPEWKQYQVVLQPSANGNSSLQFYLASQAGDVWLDDVHFQQGATNLYRRDFTNGIVLVNPADQALQVPLGQTFRRLLGLVDTATNDGASVTQVTVNPSDALFLLRSTLAPADTVPPAAIQDARVGP